MLKGMIIAATGGLVAAEVSTGGAITAGVGLVTLASGTAGGAIGYMVEKETEETKDDPEAMNEGLLD